MSKRVRMEKGEGSGAKQAYTPQGRATRTSVHSFRSAPNQYGITFTNPEQQKRYFALAKRNLVPTRYRCMDATDFLGITEDIGWLFDKGKLNLLLGTPRYAYNRIVLEFLATLEIHEGRASHKEKITFRMYDNDHELTLQELRVLFECDTEYSKKPTERNYNDDAFWNKLTNWPEFAHARKKASGIRHPAWRYFQRLLACSILGRGDSQGVCQAGDLYMMWAMVHPIYHKTPCDTARRMINHFIHNVKNSDGEIVYGSLITHIAEHLGYDLTSEKDFIEPAFLDKNALKYMKWITEEPEVHWTVKEVPICPIPIEPELTIQDESNWGFPWADEYFGDEDEDDDEEEMREGAHQQADVTALRQDINNLTNMVRTLQVQHTDDMEQIHRWHDHQEELQYQRWAAQQFWRQNETEMNNRRWLQHEQWQRGSDARHKEYYDDLCRRMQGFPPPPPPM